ncbi:hypothetical protein [Methylorubrum sp. SL192]|uniref:hypothetical protein n=1 Tax=Methylorubrum sp. SL192 TaxID=2995167 RepID=UPI0006F1E0E1|nr:hypothetical protein [Methylorubrum sp. SL192]KQO89458.1 hypothetical protein ASF33_19195 [Methylobacterium sp. Leaf92]MCY1644918.1 hypothetical protein [Methylorubrum sp. SL192]
MRACHTDDTRKHDSVTAHVRGSNERRAEASRLTEKEVKAILRSRRRIKDLARAFGVSTETMALVRSGNL